MTLLVLGLFIWVVAHMIPVSAPQLRAALAAKVGEMPYKGGFALIILASVVLMVLGWRSIEDITVLYNIYDVGIVPALFMILIGFVLMAAAKIKSNFSRLIRHPQMTGFTLWAVAHLLVNGELRTTVLFGTMALWSVATIILLNKRDGTFVVPPKQLPHKGAIVVAIGFVIFIAAVLGHGYFTGIDLSAARTG